MIDVLIIIAFNLILYFPTLCYGYVMDDCQWRDIKSKGWSKHTNIFDIIAERLHSGGTFGFNPMVDHAFTMTLWALFNVLVYIAFGHNQTSFVAALLCSCHPLNNQLSIWINGRRYLMCAILLMLTMLAWPWGLPFYLLSSLFQVTIIFAPILFLAKVKYAWTGLVFVAILGLIMKEWIVSRVKTRFAMIPAVELKQWQPRRPIIIVKIFGFYFWKMIFPGRVQMVYTFLQLFGRTKEGNNASYKIDRDFYAGCLAFICFGCIGYLMPWGYKPYVLFAFFSLLQWCAIIPCTQLIADRYVAIPNIFMCFFISYIFLHFLPLYCAWTIIGFFLGQYVISTVSIFKMYKNLDEWYDYHVFDDFGNLAISNLRIGLLMQQKKLFQANNIIEKGLEKHPNDYGLNFLGYMSAMICQAMPLAKKYLEKCKTNCYLGEEEYRKNEIADAELGIKAMSGELNINMPQRTQVKKG